MLFLKKRVKKKKRDYKMKLKIDLKRIGTELSRDFGSLLQEP